MFYAIDTHCHINFSDKDEQSNIIQRALDANVQKMINISCTMKDIEDGLTLTKKYDFIFASIGIHPTELDINYDETLALMEKYIREEDKIVAVGEIGLDYYHEKFEKDKQKSFFIEQLKLAKKTNKVSIIHSRGGKMAGENASVFPDMLKCLKKSDNTNAVMHCFSGSYDEAMTFLDMGLMLSFTGILTYKKNDELRKIVKDMDINRIMIETDSPFLAPKKYRGSKNEPAYVVEMAKEIARIKEMSLDEVFEITSYNAEKFFGI